MSFFLRCLHDFKCNKSYSAASSSRAHPRRREEQGSHAEHSLFIQVAVQEDLSTMWCADSYNGSSYSGREDVWFMVSCSAWWLLSFFWQQSLLFKTKTIKTGNIWRDGAIPKWPAVLSFLGHKRAFVFKCRLNLFIEPACSVYDWGEGNEVIFR